MKLTWKCKFNNTLYTTKLNGCTFAVCMIDGSLSGYHDGIDKYEPISKDPKEFMEKIQEYCLKYGKIC